jgi:hypothetical protein
MRPLQERKILSGKVVNNLFTNIEQVVEVNIVRYLGCYASLICIVEIFTAIGKQSASFDYD